MTTFAREHAIAGPRWCVALSGGADSLALTAAAAKVMPTTALIVDHRLQADSGEGRGDGARPGAVAGMR